MHATVCVECSEGIAVGDAVIRSARGALCGACAVSLYPESMARLTWSGAYPVELPALGTPQGEEVRS